MNLVHITLCSLIDTFWAASHIWSVGDLAIAAAKCIVEKRSSQFFGCQLPILCSVSQALLRSLNSQNCYNRVCFMNEGVYVIIHDCWISFLADFETPRISMTLLWTFLKCQRFESMVALVDDLYSDSIDIWQNSWELKEGRAINFAPFCGLLDHSISPC